MSRTRCPPPLEPDLPDVTKELLPDVPQLLLKTLFVSDVDVYGLVASIP